MPAVFTPNPAGIAALLTSPTGVVGRYILLLTEETKVLAKAQAPVVSGKLRDSIDSKFSAPPVLGQVEAGGTSAPYVIPVHEGSKGHPIDAKNAPFLVFPDKAGNIVFTKHVEHPGTQNPEPFLWNALKETILKHG
jgi:hypothetical protein